MHKIRIKNISKKFGTYEALRAIDLSIRDEEFMVLLGASGCGKTTLLRILAGLDTADDGEIWIGSRRVDARPPRRRGIAMVFQNYAIFPHLTVFENIGFGLRMRKEPRPRVEEAVLRTAKLMHIESLLHRHSGELSGGQRQRVAVARALAVEPDVILMDEPLSNLDALLRLEMRAELKGILAQSRTTTIYVTHDQVEAMSLADRISVMDRGRIVQSAAPLEVYRNPATHFVASFIGSPPMNFLEAHYNSDRSTSAKWCVAGQYLEGPRAGVTPLECAIRPEDLTPAESGFPLAVDVIEPLGPHILVTGTIEGRKFRTVLDSHHQVRSGTHLFLRPVAERIRWFHPETGHAVT